MWELGSVSLVRGRMCLVEGKNAHIGGLKGALQDSNCVILGCHITEILRSTEKVLALFGCDTMTL